MTLETPIEAIEQQITELREKEAAMIEEATKTGISPYAASVTTPESELARLRGQVASAPHNTQYAEELAALENALPPPVALP